MPRPTQEAGPNGVRILPRTPIKDVWGSVDTGLRQLAELWSSDNSIVNERAEEEDLSSLEKAVLKAQFVFGVIGPIAREYMHRTRMEKVGLVVPHDLGCPNRPVVAYEVDINGDDSLTVAGKNRQIFVIRNHRKKPHKIAGEMQELSDRDDIAQEAFASLGSLTRGALAETFIETLRRR